MGAVVELGQAYELEQFGETELSEEGLRREWEDLALGDDAWLVELDGKLAGYATVERHRDRTIADGYDERELVGAILCDWKRYGDWGWVANVGVRGPWRGRGIGEALLRTAFSEFWRAGERRVALGVDADNPTGATRLYERVGMRVLWQATVFEKTLNGR